MATIRLSYEQWSRAYAHLFSKRGEHFAFFLASWTESVGEPVLAVREVLLIDGADVEFTGGGWVMSDEALVRAVNLAVKSNSALIEAHNHGGVLPRFSGIDRRGFREVVPYMLSSLPGRPYAATVWGDHTIYAEYFTQKSGVDARARGGVVDSIIVHGKRLDQVISRDDDEQSTDPRFNRQEAWFTPVGQRRLGRIKFGVVGLGGTGGPIIQNLVYLGARDFVLVDHDASDETSMNRLVTATAADVDIPKAILARRLVKSVTPGAKVHVVLKELQTREAFDALKGVDILLGCVDNDGARVVLNELALAYGIPYFDLGVGIEAKDGQVDAAGGRIAVVLPEGPCLYCMGQIDGDEARYWLADDKQREFLRGRGYVRGMDVVAPSVAALNAAVAAAASNELAVYISGIRPVQLLLELDLLGVGRAVKSQWMTPVRVEKKAGCPACEAAGKADETNIARYRREV
jgi:molybdopterin/thiamine biosynthesis adenylyltransferase